MSAQLVLRFAVKRLRSWRRKSALSRSPMRLYPETIMHPITKVVATLRHEKDGKPVESVFLVTIPRTDCADPMADEILGPVSALLTEHAEGVPFCIKKLKAPEQGHGKPNAIYKIL